MKGLAQTFEAPYKVCSVTTKPIIPSPIAFALVPSKRIVNRRHWTDTDFSGSYNRPRPAGPVAGNPSIARGWSFQPFYLELDHRSHRCSLRPVDDQFDKLVRHRNAVAEARDIGERPTFASLSEITLPEENSFVHIWLRESRGGHRSDDIPVRPRNE